MCQPAATDLPPEKVSIGLQSTYGSNPPVTPKTVICELRYYLVGWATATTAPKGLETVSNERTNLSCSIAEPLRLIKQADTNLTFQISGFVFQIIEPEEYAGQVLTSHFDGPLASGDPFKAFTFGKRYQMVVAPKWIGDTHFRGCY